MVAYEIDSIVLCFQMEGTSVLRYFKERIAMANKKAKQKKPKQNKVSGQKGGSFEEFGSPQPAKKKKNKTQ